MSEPGAPRKPIDWEGVEREYRAGQLSIREIGRRYGVTAPNIIKKAKKLEWIQDLSENVRRETAARLARETAEGNTAGNTVSSREAVRTAAARGVEVVRQHRASAARGQRVVLGLLAELEATAACLPEIHAEIAETRHGLGKISAEQALSVGNRAKAAQALASALDTLVRVERQAFSLDAPAQEPARHSATIAGASLDSLPADALDVIERAHAALSASGVLGAQK